MEQILPKPQLLSIKELIAMLNLSKTTIYDLLKQGKFPQPFMKGRRCTRWRMADIESWLDQNQLATEGD